MHFVKGLRYILLRILYCIYRSYCIAYLFEFLVMSSKNRAQFRFVICVASSVVYPQLFVPDLALKNVPIQI
jgi:hypothetical protein